MQSYMTNLLRCYTFQYPDYIPMEINLDPIIRNYYSSNFFSHLIDTYPALFPAGKEETIQETFISDFLPFRKKGQDYIDSWGCVWRTAIDGMTGSVIKPRFPTWDGFENFKAPDPSEENGWMKIDWEQIKNQIAMDRAEKKPVIASLRHGHTLLTLEYIRGYENLIMDLFDGDKRINELIKIVSDFNYELLKRFLQLGIDIMCFPEDTGMQQGPFLTPDMFATYIIPVYKRYFDYTHSKGVIVHMHSDGDLIKHADQLVEAGIDVINPQDLVNGIEALAECFKGKVAIDLDVDRQNITINGTPKDIDDLIHEEVEKLGDESGGLKLKFDLGAHVPEKNVEALAKSFQKYMFFYS